jgi:spore coat protein CotH
LEARVTRSEAHRLLVAVTAVALLAGCGSNEPVSPSVPADPAWPFFAPDHVVEVAIEIDPANWDVLRRQTRTWYDLVVAENRLCMAQPFVKPFTWFPASVTVDGIRRDDIAVRKKGFLGSLHEDRPALKLRFDAVRPDQTLYGLTRLTLNNTIQDPTWLRQCLSYQVFAKAGVPVPWCSFAHVTVNGRDLGLYVHLESTDRRWLRRNFERDEGELWEGEVSDFRVGWTDTFEKKGDVEDDDQTKVDRSSLEAVAAGVGAADWRGELEKLIDFDEFMRFWATEKILEHWDGYSNAANNFFVYRDPADGRFVFVPAGTDQITLLDPWGDPKTPVSVYAGGILANRLYSSTGTRQLYVETLLKMLDSAFHEDELLAEIDRMQTLITPVLARAGVDLDAQARAVADLRTWIAGRRAVLLADLRDGPREWRQDPKKATCLDLAGTVSGSFATTFDPVSNPYSNVDPFRRGTGVITATYRGRTLTFSRVGAFAGYEPNDANRWPYVWLVGQSTDGNLYNIGIHVNPEQFRPGNAGPFDYAYARGWMSAWNAGQSSYLGDLVNGRVEIDAAGLQPGSPVSGRFQASVARW